MQPKFYVVEKMEFLRVAAEYGPNRTDVEAQSRFCESLRDAERYACRRLMRLGNCSEIETAENTKDRKLKGRRGPHKRATALDVTAN